MDWEYTRRWRKYIADHPHHYKDENKTEDETVDLEE